MQVQDVTKTRDELLGYLKQGAALWVENNGPLMTAEALHLFCEERANNMAEALRDRVLPEEV